MLRFIPLFILLVVSVSCKKEIKLDIQDISKSIPHTETPDLILSPQHTLYHSFVQAINDSTDALKYRTFGTYEWSEAKTISLGSDWFVNWADFPTLCVFAGTELNLMASYLEKNPTGKTYDYDIKLAISNDGGDRFKIVDTLHASIPGEHGFVTMSPYSYNKNLIVWLDGSEMKADSSNHGDHGHHGSMQLKAAFVDINGRITDRTTLDDMTCECCQTDIAITAKGPVVVYRNRSQEGERDIHYTRYINGQWSASKPIHEDHWKIGGCPVNGPAIASKGSQVVVVWYTEANGKPEIKWARSSNDGETFDSPHTLKTKLTQGRLDITWIHEKSFVISYLDKETKEAENSYLNLNIIDTSGTLLHQETIAEVSSKRKSGFPIIQSKDQYLYLAYTDLKKDTESQIITKKIDLSVFNH